MVIRLIVLAAFSTVAILAQTVGASLQGVVTDPSGAVVPKSAIEIRNVHTGDRKSVASDDAGRYREPLLPPGEYEIRASAPGFQTLVRKGLTLAVGQDAVVNLSLEIGQTTGVITVAADAARINLASGALSGLVETRQMRDLPLNGRSFQQLALLQPGVAASLASGNDVVGGRTPKISINGTRPEHSSFLLDGTDINNVYNKTPGSVAGVLLGVEAVQEFQVLTNSYSAEFGRSAGGVINAITRSGTNIFHGSAFEFLRNSAIDAKNFFDPHVKPIPPFKRNQFGGSLGGPLRRDRTFFFGAYESLVERLGISGVTNVLTADARRGILPGGRVVTLNSAIPRYNDLLFPLPNGRDLGGGIAEYLFSPAQPTIEHFFQGRVDHRFSSADSLFARFTFSNGNVDRVPPNKAPVVFTKERSRNQYLTIEEEHLFSSRFLNTIRLSFARSTQEADNVRLLNARPEDSFIPGEPSGYVTITGVVTEQGGDYRLPRLDRLNNYQLQNNAFWTRGAHGLRFGGAYQRIQFNQNTTSQRGGILVFPNLETWLTGRPSNVDFAVAGKIDPVRGYRQHLAALFFQDDIRLRPHLTLNLGVRYEMTTVPTEVHGKISNLRAISDPRVTIGAPWHTNPHKKNFAPRAGIAWDPFRTGKTSVRAGFGIFDDLIFPRYYFFSGSLNPPFTTRTSLANPPFPNVVANFDPNATIRAQLQTVEFRLARPYVMQFNTSVQRSFPGNLDLTVGYAGSRGIHLIRLGDANLAPDASVNGVKVYNPAAGRRNPNFTGVWQRITDAQSFYNALQVSVVRRFAQGLRAQLSYTFARSVDDASGINSQDFGNGIQYGMDWYDRKMDRGLSSFFAKHVLVFNWTWDLPFAQSSKGVTAALLRGWQVNNITSIQGGNPFTVRLGFNRSGNLNTTSFSQHERPNVKPGYTNNPILGGPDRYWDINAFELQPVNTRGNLGRNTLIGPGLFAFDLSAAKSWNLRERTSLQFRGEIFNLPNHPNFAVPSGQIALTNAAGAVSPTWGRITSTVTTSRQVQLGLKLTF